MCVPVVPQVQKFYFKIYYYSFKYSSRLFYFINHTSLLNTGIKIKFKVRRRNAQKYLTLAFKIKIYCNVLENINLDILFYFRLRPKPKMQSFLKPSKTNIRRFRWPTLKMKALLCVDFIHLIQIYRFHHHILLAL